MRRFHDTKQKYYCPAVNIDKILDYVKKSDLNISDTIDITKWGFFKLLGKGKLPFKPLMIKAKLFSKKAQSKIVKSGGTCVVIA
jgi:large subunit ribosomal protein L27Ae